MKTIFGLLVFFLLLGIFAPKYNGWVRLLLFVAVGAMIVYFSLT